MPQLVKKRRSGWAVLAAGALVASLLAVGAAPAGAATDTADNTTKLSACVGDALNDQMFTDVVDEHAFKDAINCVAHYGITNGSGDGSTYSPNDNVTRAEMAVFIARAAEKAGVDLGDAMSAGFSDIGDTWQEAQDAINKLATKGMIPKGGAFRPNADITRAEMATFLVGLLAKAAPNVKIDSSGKIQLGPGSVTTTADDWFPDSRASLPRANDAEISALYELGVTKGASAAAVQDDTKPPLDYNYNPSGTVNRGQMAEFITRALAHTTVRPAGITAQFDGTDVVVSVRDDDFQPRSNVTVDVFRTDTPGVDVAFRTDGSCSEVDSLGGGTYVCEIDGADPLTNSDGDAIMTLSEGVDDGGTTVWAWTGKTKDTVKDGDDGLYKLDIPEGAQKSAATKASVSTGFGGSKAHVGSSVLYTVQLQDAKGNVALGTDGKKPAKVLVTLITTALIANPSDTDPSNGTDVLPNPQGASLTTTLPLTTDSDGKATFSVSGLPGRNLNRDESRVEIRIQADPTAGNLPAATPFVDGKGTALVGLTANDQPTGQYTVGTVVFSTEGGVMNVNDITVSVKPAADFVEVDDRGASVRATVTVTNQYGDPITGVKVNLTSTDTDNENTATVIGNSQNFAVSRNGSHTFGYVRDGDVATTETLLGTLVALDHDGDGCTTALIATDNHRCKDKDPNTAGDQNGTAPLTRNSNPDGESATTVEWAIRANTSAESVTDDNAVQIRAFDKETNTIYAGANGSVWVISYDSNDRFNIDRPAPSGGGDDPPSAASTYAGFERALSKATGYTLSWTIPAGSPTGARAVYSFELNIPSSG